VTVPKGDLDECRLEAGALEHAEKATIAAARAIAHDASLRFRGNLVFQGRRIAPVRAPHVQASLVDIDVLRSTTDAIALRVLHSDSAIYLQHRPEGAYARVIYEVLEQCRVEALASPAMPGVLSNLHTGFRSWTTSCIEEGLLENDVGLLLFTVMQVCRSRIVGEPMDERVSDHTEATRAGIYPVLGPDLVLLRPAIGKQREFAEVARRLALAVEELAEGAGSGRSGGRAATSVLAMLDVDPGDDSSEWDDPLPSDGSRRPGSGDGYTVFTTQFDRTVEVTELVRAPVLADLRTRLDELVREQAPVAAAVNRAVSILFPAPVQASWESEQEQGLIDPRLLSRLASGTTDPRIFRTQVPVLEPAGAVTVLVDCSGSMKAVIERVAVLVDLLVRALDRVDIATEVLGFTTGAWSGGRARAAWISAGRPPHPGRLNESCRLVMKDASSSWRRGRRGIAGLLSTSMFREGIDGEAVEWAFDRLVARPAASRALIVISDGSPMDGATTLANGEGYLDRHLAEVIRGIEEGGRVRMVGLGIGHDMSAYLDASRIVDPGQVVSRDVGLWLLAQLRGG